MSKNYAAVVLAGGIGSRLRPLTSDIPKPLNPVAGFPMIDYNLFMLKKNNIKDVIIAVKYLGDKIIDYIGDGSRYGLNVIYPDMDPIGTADAVRWSAEYLGERPFICTMADVITNLDLEAFIKFHERKKEKIVSIALKHVDEPRAFGVTMLSENEEILLFLEKPIPQELYFATLSFQESTSHLNYNLVNMGIYIFENQILDLLKKFPDIMDFGKDVFPLIQITKRRNEKIFGYVSNPYWMDAGNPQKYKWANWDVLRKWSWPYLPRGTERDGSWWGDELKIGNNFKSSSPIVIGSKCDIGNDVTVEKLSAIGDNVAIGEKTIIDKSIIWNDVSIGKNCSIRSSIICNGVKIEDDVVIEEGCVIGAETKIKKGSHIKKNSKITRNDSKKN